jgi:acetylornithine deacetylase
MKLTKQPAREVAHEARKLNRPLRAHLRRLLQELIRTNSVAIPPEGNETPAQCVLKDFLHEFGIRTELYEIGPILARDSRPLFQRRHFSGRKNLSAWIEGRGTGKSLLLNGHMKGGLVAHAAVLCALKRANLRLGGDLFFESVIDEEWGGGAGTYAALLRGVTADACVISEGTQLDIYRATRGGVIVDLVVEAGDPTAYFSKSEVISPAIPFGRLLGWVDSWAKRRSSVQTQGAYAGISDPTPVQVLAVEANRLDPEVPLSVPMRATLRVYFQFLPNENIDAIVEEITKSLHSFGAADPFFSKHPIQWKPLLELTLQGHEVPAEHPWVECMAKSAADASGSAPIVTGAPYPCDAGLVQRRFGIPTLLFGPSGAGAHNPNEYVEFDSVILAAEAILGAALTWASA